MLTLLLALFLEPAPDHHFAIAEEVDHLTPLAVQGAEERLLSAAEGEVGHGGGHADIDAHVADVGPVGELASPAAVLRKDARRIAVRAVVDEREGLVERRSRHDRQNRAEDLIAR